MLSQEVDREALAQWVVERWNAEVAPLAIFSGGREVLDNTWRQVLTKLGADHVALLGYTHYDMLNLIRCLEVSHHMQYENLELLTQAQIVDIAKAIKVVE